MQESTIEDFNNVEIEKSKVSYKFKTVNYKNCASVIRPVVRFSSVDKKGLKREYRIGKIS